jgi:hypothetical protein
MFLEVVNTLRMVSGLLNAMTIFVKYSEEKKDKTTDATIENAAIFMVENL